MEKEGEGGLSSGKHETLGQKVVLASCHCSASSTEGGLPLVPRGLGRVSDGSQLLVPLPRFMLRIKVFSTAFNEKIIIVFY